MKGYRDALTPSFTFGWLLPFSQERWSEFTTLFSSYQWGIVWARKDTCKRLHLFQAPLKQFGMVLGMQMSTFRVVIVWMLLFLPTFCWNLPSVCQYWECVVLRNLFPRVSVFMTELMPLYKATHLYVPYFLLLFFLVCLCFFPSEKTKFTSSCKEMDMCWPVLCQLGTSEVAEMWESQLKKMPP